MKNIFKFFGVLAFTSLLVFSLIGCDIETDDGNGGQLNGIWDRGDIIITFNGSQGVFSDIKSGSAWNGIVSIGDRKFRNITYKDNLTWSCQEMDVEKNWHDGTITMSSDKQTIQAYTPNTNPTTSTYTRK